MVEQSEPGNFLPKPHKYTHFSHLLEVVHSTLTIAVFLIVYHMVKNRKLAICDYF